jgi:hypothetical protein
MASAAGFAALFSPIPNRRSVPYVMALIAIGVALFEGSRVQSSPSIYMSTDGRGIEALALYLKGELKAGDSVVTASPSDALLLYYFQKEGVPSSYINAAAKPGRMFVVVNKMSGDTVQKVLQETKRTVGDSQTAKLLVKYDSACLYDVRQ